MSKLKVFVLSGFLGSGKTTLVKHILTNSENKKIAVVLNDISQIDIDSDLILSKALKVKKQKDIIQMSNGCICCTLKEDMVKQVKKISKSGQFQYLVIEATGVSTPLPVAQAFTYTPGIQKYAQVYSMITVIDAENFEKNLINNDLVKEEQRQIKKYKRGKKHNKQLHKHEQEEEETSIAELMLDQLQIANLVIINKIDLVSQAQKQSVRVYIHNINPDSDIIFSQYSFVQIDQLFKKRFNLQKSETCLKWIAERAKTVDIPETIKYNISSFIYRARRPFDPVKFHQLITNPKFWPLWLNVTRCKGFFWLANYPRYQYSIHKAGRRIFYEIEKPWYSQMPRKKWTQTKEELKDFQKFIQKYWQQPHGDKRIQIVFICKDLDQQTIQQEFDLCLIPLKDMENYQQIYKKSEDPFKGLWNNAFTFFEENQMLTQKQGDWEEVDEDESD